MSRIEDAIALCEEHRGVCAFRAVPGDGEHIEPMLLRLEVRDRDALHGGTLAVYPLNGGEPLFTLLVGVEDVQRIVERAMDGDAPTGEDDLVFGD